MKKPLKTKTTWTPGACEQCGAQTNQIAWNQVYEQWDYLCGTCSREMESREDG